MDLRKEILNLLNTKEGDDFKEAVKKLIYNSSPASNLVLLINKGIHNIPMDKLPEGKLVTLTEGNLSIEELPSIIENMIKKIKEVLTANIKEIYLIPSGFPVLLAFASLAVKQITAKDPAILQWDRDSNFYRTVRVDVRKVIAG
jgi:hypothetical protein